MARSLRAPFVVVTAILVSSPGCSESSPPSEALRPTPVPCSTALKGGEPCDEGSCSDSCSSFGRRVVTCVNHQWKVATWSCNPPGWGSPDSGNVIVDDWSRVGLPCAKNEECDLTGEAIAICSRGAFSGGDSVYATNVCIETTCNPAVPLCAHDRGTCVATSVDGICFPLCIFDDTGAAPEGCIGKNACVAYAPSGAGDAGVEGGLGYCFGGCTADEDCLPAGENKCQRETGRCVRTPVAYTKSLGAACSDAEKACNCTFEKTTKLGYCTQFCRAGIDSCPTGFACDPKLADTFTKIPLGISGQCLKECTSDADCINAKCTASGALATKTCKP